MDIVSVDEIGGSACGATSTERSAGHRVHVLKTHPGPFAAVRSRKKTLDIRKNDRDYREGDTLWLDEFDPVANAASGEVEIRVITHVLEGGQYGIEPGYVALSITDGPLQSSADRWVSSAEGRAGNAGLDTK